MFPLNLEIKAFFQILQCKILLVSLIKLYNENTVSKWPETNLWHLFTAHFCYLPGDMYDLPAGTII